MEAKGVAAWKPLARDRKVSKALQAYAALATSAARGAVRDVTQIQKNVGGNSVRMDELAPSLVKMAD
jgi:hypothetical protein